MKTEYQRHNRPWLLKGGIALPKEANYAGHHHYKGKENLIKVRTI